MLLYVRWWVVGGLALFLFWQMWVFLSPKPRELDAAELRAANRVCDQVVSAIAEKTGDRNLTIGLVHLLGDSSDQITDRLRLALNEPSGWTVDFRSVPQAVISDIAHALADASTFEEILNAGDRVSLQLMVMGRIKEVTRINEGAYIGIDIFAYDIQRGEWLLRKDFEAVWEPGAIQLLNMKVSNLPLWQKLILWLIIVGLLPWVTPFATRWAIGRKTNQAGFLVLASYVAVGLFLAGLFMGFELSGFFSWVAFIVSLALACAYNYWACEKIADDLA